MKRIKIVVPTCWEDVTLNKYQALKEIDRDDFKTDYAYSVEVIKVLCDLDDISLMNIKTQETIINEIGFINEPITTNKIKQFNFEGNFYKWGASLNGLTVGEMLSIEQMIDLEELSYTMSYDVVCAVLLRQDNETEFDADKFNERREIFGRLPITYINGMIGFFLRGGQIYTTTSQEYLVTLSRMNTNIPKLNKLLKTKLQRLVIILINGYQWLTNLASKI